VCISIFYFFSGGSYNRQTEEEEVIYYTYTYLFLMAVFDIFFTCLKTIERKDRKGLFLRSTSRQLLTGRENPRTWTDAHFFLPLFVEIASV
jgi:hypothetical protein